MRAADYDDIGRNYADFRREDPVLALAISEALGDSGSVVNVGAGTGSYEPSDREMVAVEPSEVMRSQRPEGRGPSVAGLAQSLPFADGAFDAAMSVLSLHHWHPDQERGVTEMQRVASTVVIVTIDPAVSGSLWFAEYLPEVASLDFEIFPEPAEIVGWLSGEVSIRSLPIDRDTPDWSLLSYWAHPKRFLDPAARRATSGLSRLDDEIVDRGAAAIERDLASGEWERRWGHLLEIPSLDAGLRLITAR